MENRGMRLKRSSYSALIHPHVMMELSSVIIVNLL